MHFKIWLIVVICSVFSLNAQLSKSDTQKVDSLFAEWDAPDLPGGAIGVMINGETVFSKAYGRASLEYDVPNTPGTIFNTGSVSKQFTAMGIVLLDQRGEISVDDDIRKYLPELPEFEEKITIRHMLHHTSGLRSLHAMLELAGWRGDDSRTNEDLNRFMRQQKDLNFKPGDEYAYCNTGYMLMVNIIEKVSGEEFPEWMKENIFEPLGMNNTYVEDNYNRVVPNNATSYYRNVEKEYERSVEYWGYVGSGNMHSTTADLLKWLKNFYSPRTKWQQAFKTIQTLDKFNDGFHNEYAFGVVVDRHNGYERIQHGGAIGGFRAFVSVYPKEKLSIAILANFPTNTRAKSDQIAAIVFSDSEGEYLENSTPGMSTPKRELSTEELVKYAASYWNDKENYARKIYIKNDTLRYYRSPTSESPIVPIGKDVFQMLGVSAELKIEFILNDGEKKMMVTESGGRPSLFHSFEIVEDSRANLEEYSGKFYSPELETAYSIYTKADTLYYHHARHGDYSMKVIKKDVIEGEWPMLIAKYQRDESGKINGILVSNGRVRNLWFEKVE